MKKFIAGENENGVRLSRFVESVTRDMPRSLLYKSFRNKRIKVNGKRGEADTRLSSGDVIELYINDEFFPKSQWPRLRAVAAIAGQGDLSGRKHCGAVQARPPAVPQRPHWRCQPGGCLLCPAAGHKANTTPRLENRFAPAICNRLTAAPRGL